MINVYEEYLPEEFKSGNDILVERATITRQRMLDIIAEIVDGVYEDAYFDGHYDVHGIYT